MQRRILVIDDDPDIVRLFALVLGKRGDIVDVAANGREALAKVVEGRPEIIFLDLMMPELDGFEIVEALCSAGVSRPHLYVMTAKRLTHQERAYLEVRVERIIQKGTEGLAQVLGSVMQKFDAQ